jgi:membrane protease YdiL (CAAX protease family)
MIVSSAHRPALGGYREHPLILAVLIVAVVLATAAPIALGVTVDAAYAIGSKVVLCGLAVVLLAGFRWWGRAGFLALPGRRDLAWLAPPALLVLATLAAVVVAGPVPMEPTLVLAFAIVALGTGFSEEALFRGVLLESLRPRGAVWAIIGTTLAFATIHFAGLMGGATLEATLTQVLLGGIPFGLAFAGLRLATRSIWPLVVLHAMNNFTSYLMSGHWEAVSQDMSRFGLAGALQLGLLVVLMGYGVWFVWRFSRDR